MPGSTARAAYTCAMRFTSQLRCQSTSGASTLPETPSPAFEQNRSMRPYFSVTNSTSRSTSPSRLTSVTAATPPISFATCSAGPRCRSAMMTASAPSEAKRRHSAAPIPFAPPVTTTIFPLSCISTFSNHVAFARQQTTGDTSSKADGVYGLILRQVAKRLHVLTQSVGIRTGAYDLPRRDFDTVDGLAQEYCIHIDRVLRHVLARPKQTGLHRKHLHNDVGDVHYDFLLMLHFGAELAVRKRQRQQRDFLALAC